MRTFIFVITIVITVAVQGQTVPIDTVISKELNEVVVHADRVYMTRNKVSYTPNKSQKNSATNGLMLLQNLAIPQLQVNTLTGNVTSNTNESVSFFIDGVPVTESDIADMNTRDVRRVEILNHPTDPRFRNVAHAVNFIMQRYEYGGYTKINSTEMFLHGLSSINTINSKMILKNFTFDARAYYQYSNINHFGTSSTEWFYLSNYQKDTPKGITRTQSLDNSKIISQNSGASFRVMYNNNNIQFSSTINYLFKNNPINRSKGDLIYTPEIFENRTWNKENPLHNNAIKWNNDLFFKLPKNWSLAATFELTYDHNNNIQTNTEGETSYRNLNAKENIWSTGTEIQITKKINEKNSISLNTSCFTYNSDITYLLSSESTFSKNEQNYICPLLVYNYTPSEHLQLEGRIGGVAFHSNADGLTEDSFHPIFNFNLEWLPIRGHRLGLGLWYNINTPIGSQTNPILLQNSALLWSQGNPKLKSFGGPSINVSYTWNPSQYINISPVAAWTFKKNYYTDCFFQTSDGKAIIMRPENCGNYQNGWAAINFSMYTLNQKLVFQFRPFIDYHKFTGTYNFNKILGGINMAATYYWNQFYVGASYTSPQGSYDQTNPMYRKKRSNYWIMAGWGNSKMSIQAVLLNPFRSHWFGDHYSLSTPIYSYEATSINADNHRRLQISLSYNIGYGKKVKSGNDLQSVSTGQSSIR